MEIKVRIYKGCIDCDTELRLDPPPPTTTPAMLRARRTRCLACHNKFQAKYNEAYRRANGEQASKRTQIWREENPEKYQLQLERAKQKRRDAALKK